jgi:hypothetical protein
VRFSFHTGARTLLMCACMRPQEGAEPLQYLIDNQCMWFEIETGRSYQRQGNMGRALRMFHEVLGVSDYTLAILVCIALNLRAAFRPVYG